MEGVRWGKRTAIDHLLPSSEKQLSNDSLAAGFSYRWGTQHGALVRAVLCIQTVWRVASIFFSLFKTKSTRSTVYKMDYAMDYIMSALTLAAIISLSSKAKKHDQTTLFWGLHTSCLLFSSQIQLTFCLRHAALAIKCTPKTLSPDCCFKTNQQET